MGSLNVILITVAKNDEKCWIMYMNILIKSDTVGLTSHICAHSSVSSQIPLHCFETEVSGSFVCEQRHVCWGWATTCE